MRKGILCIVLSSLCCLASYAGDIVDNVSVDKVIIERQGNYLSVDAGLEISQLKVSSGQSVSLILSLVNGSDSLAVDTVEVYGRRRYYTEVRNGNIKSRTSGENLFFLAKDCPEHIGYHGLVPYAGWMDGATLTLRRIDRGCCRKPLLDEYGELARYQEAFFPELIYSTPAASREKRRTLEGKAYIDFPVDQTVIYPDYRRNQTELAAIRATIDTIRSDSDARIDTVWLKGFASPESPYAHNTDLARGRTEALRSYIQQLYHFDGVVMLTDFEPEDWDGLRRVVLNSNLDNRDAILAIIDSDIEADAREAKIKRLYPADYKFMLQNFYPALRHTDYKVSYVIRSYNDPAEILDVMKHQPQKLDLNEFYVAASEFEPGTEQFTDIYETAVRMYPDDPAANLNAANAAIRRGDFDAARRYVRKAGDSPEAAYAAGAIAIREKDYPLAIECLRKAADAGLPQARATLEELQNRL